MGSLTLSRSRGDAAAILTAQIQTAAADTYFLKLTAAVGDPVRLLDDEGREVFLGSIHELRRTPEQVNITAYDQGVFLTRNELYGVFAGTPDQIVAGVAERLGIPLGNIDAPGGRRAVVARAGQSAYDILRQVVGRERYIGIVGGSLTVTGLGEIHDIAPERVLEVSAAADIRGMVNRCVVVGRNGATLARAENAGDLAMYGQFQQLKKNQRESAKQRMLFFRSNTHKRKAKSLTTLGHSMKNL